MMSYLCGMTDIPLMLCTDRTNIYKWWVDGSHGVNTNFRGHTGASQSQEKFPIISAPTKQKLNTRSSTEIDLVAADESMLHATWTSYFLDYKRYKVKETIMYKDRKSEILLEKNGKNCISKKTNHINIRNFLSLTPNKLNQNSSNVRTKTRFRITSQIIIEGKCSSSSAITP